MYILTLILGGAIVAASNPWERDYRIPKDVVPVSYNVFLDPNLDAGVFKGEVTALVNITAPRDWIPIHIKNLNISKTVLTNSTGKPVKVSKAFKYTPNQFWVIKTERLHPGLIKIYLKFKGSLTESITGFYKSVYRENGIDSTSNIKKHTPDRCLRIHSLMASEEPIRSYHVPSIYFLKYDEDLFGNIEKYLIPLA